MTSKELCEAINASLFVPITEAFGKQLLEVAESFVPLMNAGDVDNYSRAFFKNKVSPSYISKFKTQYKRVYGSELILPAIAFEVLETCQVLLFLQSDNVDDDLKVRCSLIVRNNAIWRKGDWYGVLCTSWIEAMYESYSEYNTKVFTNNNNFDSLLKAIVPHSSWSDTGMNINDSATYNSLRSLCATVMRGRIGSFADAAAFKNLRSPFSKVYLLVNKMVKEWQWKYIDDSPVKRIIDALGDEAKKRKSLSKIAGEVNSELSKSSIFVPNENSSALLYRISDGCNSELDVRLFSVLELGVYLYYELLLETYND